MKILKYIAVWFSFGVIAFTLILLLTGAFRFAISFIEETTPKFIDWLGIVFVFVISGGLGLILYMCDVEDK